MRTRNHLFWVGVWVLSLTVLSLRADEKPEDLTGHIKCGTAKKVLDVADLKKIDVAVEYWATGTCRASFVPAGGETSGKHSEEAKGGGDKKEGPHEKALFRNVTSLEFSCIEGSGGECHYKILKAVAAGQDETDVDEAKNNHALACPKDKEENSSAILKKPHGVCDVTVKGSGSKEGCKAVIGPDDGPIRDAPEEYTTFVGVTKGFLLRCDGAKGGEGCHFSYSVACRER